MGKVRRKRRRSRTPSSSRTPRKRTSGQDYRKRRKVVEESPSKTEILKQIKAMNYKMDIFNTKLDNGVDFILNEMNKGRESNRTTESNSDKQCTVNGNVRRK